MSHSMHYYSTILLWTLIALIQANRRGIRYPSHLLLTYMYPRYNSPTWWADIDDNCPPEERNRVMDYVMGPIDYDLITDYSAITDTGIVSPPLCMLWTTSNLGSIFSVGVMPFWYITISWKNRYASTY